MACPCGAHRCTHSQGRITAKQSGGMSSFGGRGKLVTGGGVMHGKPKRKQKPR